MASLKKAIFDLLDEWVFLGYDISAEAPEIAIDLLDEFDITLEEARRFIDKWLIHDKLTKPTPR